MVFVELSDHIDEGEEDSKNTIGHSIDFRPKVDREEVTRQVLVDCVVAGQLSRIACCIASDVADVRQGNMVRGEQHTIDNVICGLVHEIERLFLLCCGTKEQGVETVFL